MHGFIAKILAPALVLVLAGPFAYGQGGGGGGASGGSGTGATGGAGRTGAPGGAGAGMAGRNGGVEQVAGAGPGNGPGVTAGTGGATTGRAAPGTQPGGTATPGGAGRTTNPGTATGSGQAGDGSTAGGNGQTGSTRTSWFTGRPITAAGGGAGTPPAAVALSGVGGDGLPRNIMAPLFRDIEVQKKLNITPAQLGQLGEADVRLRLALKSQLRETERLSRAAAAVRSDELLLKYNSDLMHATARILDAQQMERYRQLSRASEGLHTFTDPDVVKGLRLTDKQQDRLQALREQTDKKMGDLTKKAGTDVAETLEKAGALRREAMTQAGPILEPGQKEIFAKMTGYRFAKEAGPGRGGSGR
jgi:hypothetical protein